MMRNLKTATLATALTALAIGCHSPAESRQESRTHETGSFEVATLLDQKLAQYGDTDGDGVVDNMERSAFKRRFLQEKGFVVLGTDAFRTFPSRKLRYLDGGEVADWQTVYDSLRAYVPAPAVLGTDSLPDDTASYR